MRVINGLNTTLDTFELEGYLGEKEVIITVTNKSDEGESVASVKIDKNDLKKALNLFDEDVQHD